MSFEVRRIRPDGGLHLRAFRLRALAETPSAFSSTLVREQAFPDDVWHERAADGAAADDRVTFVAERDGTWIGLVTGLAHDPETSRPVLVGMFVDSAERRRSVGIALVEAVAAWARDRGTARLYLWVTATNAAAIALYDRCGFRPTGETKPRLQTPTVTEVEMVRDLP